jgi:hypothetical protein
MSKHITIASDKNYFLFGLSLVRSLQKHSSIPLIIHYYCIDDFTFNTLKALDISGVIPYSPLTITSTQSNGFRLSFVRPVNASIYGEMTKLKNKEYHYFCWSIASVFTNYIMNTVECDSVTYVDADILFHKDINLIYEQIQDKDIGIFKHRFLRDDEVSPYGKYNVGVVYFKNSELGKKLLSWWADAVVWKKYPEYSTMGDQKYLEYFPKVCSSSQIYIDDNIGHGAPWQWQMFQLDDLKNGNITWRGQLQPLVFTHFSKFVYDIANNTFSCTRKDIYTCWTDSGKVYENKDLYSIHEQYFEELKTSDKLLKDIGIQI